MGDGYSAVRGLDLFFTHNNKNFTIFVLKMLTGLPPFYDTNVQRMYHKILHDPLKFPKGEK